MLIKSLYKKIEEFQAASTKKLHCQEGCSRCCYVSLSVFEIEAQNIREWFIGLPEDLRKKILKQWEEPLKKMVNFLGEESSSCVFLHNEICTIYEARPLICRSQGEALFYKDNGKDFLDICPLNEEVLPGLTGKDYLNLDLLNSTLSRLELMDSKGEQRSRVLLSELVKELKNY